MDTKTPLYSIVVPVFNSEHSLEELHEETCAVFDTLGSSFELILVEDCGIDNSWEVMKSLRSRDRRVKIIRLTKNFGQHNALMCGFSVAQGDFVITMDDDLQTPPQEIPKLINGLHESELDVVYGLPQRRKQSAIRNLGSTLYRYLIGCIFSEQPRSRLSSFRIIRKDIVDHILQIPTPNPLIGLLILKVTDNVGSVEVENHQRKYGKTNYTPLKLVRHFLNGILYHSTLPLKAVCLLGICTSSLSVLLSIYYLILYATGRIGVQGWVTIVLLVLFFSGTIMFSIGIIGEFLLRIIQEVGRMPTYLVKEKDV